MGRGEEVEKEQGINDLRELNALEIIGMLLFLLYFLKTFVPANPQNGTNTNTSHLPAVITFL